MNTMAVLGGLAVLSVWLWARWYREHIARHRVGAPQRIDWELEDWLPPPPPINQTPFEGLTSESKVILEGDYSHDHVQRALFALDAIRLGVEGRLGLKGQMLSAAGVTTVTSNLAYFPGDAKIVRAAKRALTGSVTPKVSR